MEKTDVECTTRKKPGPKPKYTEEEIRQRRLESNKRYRQTAKGRNQKKKDDAKYFASERGKIIRRQSQKRHRVTDKGKQTYKRYWQSEKGRKILHSITSL